jgi:YhcH/YjgK/YiaL family protein
MKKMIAAAALVLFVLVSACTNERSFSATPTKHQAKKWFRKKEWLNGLQLNPSGSINYVEFYRQYHANKDYWDKAFAFMKNRNLETLAPGRYDIDGDNVYASITENPTKDFDSTMWESHRKYIDLQYVISGKEKIGVASPEKLTVIRPYNEARDAANYSGNGTLYDATPGTFFLFFPSDAHRPNIAAGDKQPDKKLVIKIRYAE